MDPLREVIALEQGPLSSRLKTLGLAYLAGVGVVASVVGLFEPFGVSLATMGLRGVGIALGGPAGAVVLYAAARRIWIRERAFSLLRSRIMEHGNAQIIKPPEPDIELLESHEAIVCALTEIVQAAKATLAATGSRSRDQSYLKVIEAHLHADPKLVHYRILFGPPHYQVFKDHLSELLRIRDPSDRTRAGCRTIYIGLFENNLMEPERFITTNDHDAIVVLPSLHGPGKYDTAIRLRGKRAERMLAYSEALYLASRDISDVKTIDSLPVIRDTKAAQAEREG